jgi:hypothetical protein
MKDAGADHWSDFPNAGLASTYTTPIRALEAARSVLQDLSDRRVDLIVAELGGDIIEANIPEILKDELIKKNTRAILHVAGDILGIMGSLQWYKELGITQPIYLTLPKGRNQIGTQKRLDQFGLHGFDSLHPEECDQIAKEIGNGFTR